MPTIAQALQHFEFLKGSVIPRLAALLVNHSLQTHFNISLAHRHFLLFDHTEQVVELKSRNGPDVSSIFKDGQPMASILQKYDLVVPTAPTIVPDTFLIHDGKLLPYEYTCLEIDQADSYLNAICHIHDEFLDEWSKVLVETGSEKRLGLVLRPPGEMVKLQLCDPSSRVDIIVSAADKSCLPLSPKSVPAEWEIKWLGHGRAPSIRPVSWCRDWSCICGMSNNGETCVRCGRPCSYRPVSPPSKSKL